MTTPAMLASSRRAYVIAAAGCGKTHLITDAVECNPDGRQLILTHTNAGVDVLRRRLASRGIGNRRAHVETISGFALKYAAAYPKTCQVDVAQPTGSQWREVQVGATRFLGTQAGRKVIGASYSGLYVDEYQDCTQNQHELICGLSEVLPTRLLGDPLQAIFDFAGEQLVDFGCLDQGFERLDDLTHPWRWDSSNPELGDWLLYARRQLLSGQDPDFRGAPVNVGWAGDTSRVCTPQQLAACKRLGLQDSVVAIRRLPHAAHATAKNLRGIFTSMEEMDCGDLLTAAKKFDQSSGSARAAVLIEFASKCMTKVSSHLSSAVRALKAGRLPTARGGQTAVAVEALARLAADDAPENMLNALTAMSALPDVVLHRAELFEEMCRALREAERSPGASYFDVAWGVRDRTRRYGRRAQTRVVSRTLLIKGLEFDHAVVLDYGELGSMKEKYVALTRPRKSLTVMTR